jgi:glycosyltransferase involved in cell wall biosynthesis
MTDYLPHAAFGNRTGGAFLLASPPGPRAPSGRRWTVLLPFHNERDELPATLASLAVQNLAFDLILIDNGSTDDSRDAAIAAAARLGLRTRLVIEMRPGKVAALAAGLTVVETLFVATCDADTYYPPDYLCEAERIMLGGCHVGAGAYFVSPDAGTALQRAEALHICAAGRLLRQQCHAGGAGQVFRTSVLRAAGGFDPARWNWVLEDHEIVHRVLKFGSIGYGRFFWAAPSPRYRNRPCTRWSLTERLVYHLTSSFAPDWFFYSFLRPRLRSRSLMSERLRERSREPAVALAET